ncbi:hypothetical protein GEMRC1_012266 [Eukaryota sp. GEM-RC1]
MTHHVFVESLRPSYAILSNSVSNLGNEFVSKIFNFLSLCCLIPMSSTLIYIDADNFDFRHAAALLDALRNLFGFEAVISPFHSSNEVKPHPKQKESAEAWTVACGSVGLELQRVQPANGLKNSADIALVVQIFKDLFCTNRYTDSQRKDLTIVIASGDSDFYHVINALRHVVKRIIICGKNQINERYKNTTRFIAYETLIGDFIASVLKSLSGNASLTIDDVEHHLVNRDLSYWPMNYGCKTTSDLLAKFSVLIGDQPVSAHSILQTLKTGRRTPPRVVSPRPLSPVANTHNKSYCIGPTFPGYDPGYTPPLVNPVDKPSQHHPKSDKKQINIRSQTGGCPQDHITNPHPDGFPRQPSPVERHINNPFVPERKPEKRKICINLDD